MNRTDHAVVGGLVLAARRHRGRRSACRRSSRPRRRPSPPPTLDRRVAPVPRGRRSAGRSRSARSPRGRRPIATSSRCVFAGLVRLRPGRRRSCPDLAERWTVDATGKTWTFTLRADARWHDGEPVTADDVVFTIRRPAGPGLHGPGRRLVAARSTATAARRADGPVHAGDAARRLPPGARPSRSPRPTCSATSRSTRSPTTRSARRPVGSGPFALDRARRRPRRPRAGRGRRRPSGPAATRPPARRSPTDSARDAGADAPAGRSRCRSSRGIEFRFFDDAGGPRRGVPRAASSTPRRACRRRDAGELAATRRRPAAALPGLDADRRPAQPAAGPPRAPRPGGPAGAARRRSTGRRSSTDGVRRARGRSPTRPIPPTSWAFDAAAEPADRARREGGRRRRSRRPAGRRSTSSWRPAGAKDAVHDRAAQPGRGDEPGRCAPPPSASPPTGRRSGFTVERRRGCRRATFVSDRLADGRVHGGRRSTSRSGSTRTSTRCSRRARRRPAGSNVIGLQDRGARRAPRRPPASPARTRPARPPTRPSRPSWRRAATSSRSPSPTRSSWSATRVEGPVVQPGRGPVGSILGCANMAPRRRPVSRASRSCRVDAEVAKLADALASGASVRKGVWVQVPSSVPPLPPDPTTLNGTPAQVAELVYAYV